VRAETFEIKAAFTAQLIGRLVARLSMPEGETIKLMYA
jgi:hypothetical protein